MGRKAKDIDLRGLDPESQEYWEEVLFRADLQMTRGQNTRRLSYIGGSAEVDRLHGFQTVNDGRVVPKGEKPE